MINDSFDQPIERSNKAGHLLSTIGVALMLGPALGSAALKVDSRLPFAAVATCCAANLIIIRGGLRESLKTRQPMKLANSNPLSFVGLFRPQNAYNRLTGGLVARLSLVFALQRLDYAGIRDLVDPYARCVDYPAPSARDLSTIDNNDGELAIYL